MIGQLSYSTLSDALRQAALTQKGITFVRTRREQVRYTYKQLYEQALALLFRCQTAGFRAGAEVVILSADQFDFLRAFWACVLGGYVPVPITTGPSQEHQRKFFSIWRQLAQPHLIASKTVLNSLKSYADENGLDEQPAESQTIFLDQTSSTRRGTEILTDADSLAFIQFSSGSTDHSKGVLLTHRNLITNICAMHKRSRTENSEQVLLSWMPLTHDMGLIGFHLTPVVFRWEHVLMPPELFQRDPLFWLEQVSAHCATVTGSPNSGLRHTLKHFKPERQRQLELHSLRFLLNGGEPISVALCNEFLTTFQPYGLSRKALFPVYGLAEASLAVTFPEPDEPFRTMSVCAGQLGLGQAVVEIAESDDRSLKLVEVGSPVKECSVRIVDDNGRELPENIVGRIQIRGRNVTSGYYSKTALRKQSHSPGERDQWLDTGDLGLLHAGRLIVTGRQKECLFANGQNFYPDDIERAVSVANGIEVENIAVVRYEPQPLVESAAAFVVYRGALNGFPVLASAIKEQVAREFGLILTEVVPIRRIPRTTSGKVQRVRLGKELAQGTFEELLNELHALEDNRAEKVSTASNQLTIRIMEIWTEVLNDPTFKISDNFFARGGNSLNAARAVSIIGNELGIELPLRLIFDHPVAQDFAANMPLAAAPAIPIKTASSDVYPLLPEQEALCALQAAYPETTAYNVSFAIRLNGRLDVARLENAFRLLVERHSVLRTGFVLTGSRLFQQVKQKVEVALEFELSTRAELKEKLESFVRPFSLESAPLFRAKLFRLSGTEHVLACDAHHAILDGISVLQLLEELTQFYNSDPLTTSAPQFGNYVLAWDASATASTNAGSSNAREVFAVDLPTDFPRPAQRTFSGARVSFALTAVQTNSLRKLAAAHGATLYAVLLSLFFILLSRLSGQQDVTVATPFAGRSDFCSWRCIGMFVRTVLLQASPSRSFPEFLRQVSNAAITAFEQAQQREAGRHEFEHMFVFQELKLPRLSMEGLELAPVEVQKLAAKCDLCLEGWDRGDHISFALEYCTDLFRAETAEQFATYYQNLVAAVIAQPENDVFHLPMLDQREETRLIHEFNTAVEYPKDETVHGLFEQQVRRTPDADALICAETNRRLSYSELDQAANALAGRLRVGGLGRAKVAAILLDRSLDLVIAVLAVLKAGGAYLPLADDLPDSRMKLLVNESKAIVVIAQRDRAERLTHLNLPIVEPAVTSVVNDQSSSPQTHATARDLAYLIYTSGTSANPKGVLVEHGSLVNYLTWASKTYARGDAINFALHTSLSFDLTVTSLFTPLISGNAIIIYPPGGVASTLRAILADRRVGAVKLTPTHLKLIRDEDAPVYPSRLVVGGEILETEVARALAIKHPQLEIYNEYGPTEATVGCIVHRFDVERDKGPSVPIGSPIANCQIYLLDQYGRPAPTGGCGEIFISGDCLARGYLGDAALTDDRFVPNRFTSSGRMYRTGDLAKRLVDGNLECLGRRDEQLKIRGYRVSIEEIRATLLLFPGIRDAVVSVELDVNGQLEVWAYLATDVELTNASLRTFLYQRLPTYFVPNKFFTISNLPLTPNGKLDRQALALSATQIGTDQDYDAPVDETETRLSQIWSKVLGVESVGRTDNFFDLGGDSIKALLIVSKAKQAGLVFNEQHVLQSQTIAELARNTSWAIGPATARTPEHGAKRLTPIETWFFAQDFSRPQQYCQSVLLRLSSRANQDILRKALVALVNRHDALRLNCDPNRQTVWFKESEPEDGPALLFIDLTEESELQVRRSILQTAEKIREQFDLRQSWLFQPALFRVRKADLLLLVAHHLLVDGISWRILLEDFETSYRSFSTQSSVQLAQQTASLSEWAEGLAKYGQSERALTQLDFWKRITATSSAHSVSTDSLVTYCRKLDVEETAKLLRIARTYKTDPSTLLIVAVLLWLRESSDRNTHTLELEHHGRTLEGLDVSRTVGWFTALFPLTLTLPEATVNEQIKAVQEQVRTVPDGGLGYGVLKYIARCKELQQPVVPAVRFNYLGEFGAALRADVFAYASEVWSEEWFAPESTVAAGFQIDCLTLSGELRIILQGRGLTSSLADGLTANLREVIVQAASPPQPRFTPSDFDTLTLEQQDLDEILT